MSVALWFADDTLSGVPLVLFSVKCALHTLPAFSYVFMCYLVILLYAKLAQSFENNSTGIHC